MVLPVELSPLLPRIITQNPTIQFQQFILFPFIRRARGQSTSQIPGRGSNVYCAKHPKPLIHTWLLDVTHCVHRRRENVHVPVTWFLIWFNHEALPARLSLQANDIFRFDLDLCHVLHQNVFIKKIIVTKWGSAAVKRMSLAIWTARLPMTMFRFDRND